MEEKNQDDAVIEELAKKFAQLPKNLQSEVIWLMDNLDFAEWLVCGKPLSKEKIQQYAACLYREKEYRLVQLLFHRLSRADIVEKTDHTKN